MNQMVFDTETTSTQKPFCYDVGYIIFDDETGEVHEKKHFVVEQIWHNLPLFESAYYNEKRPLYVQLMRSRQAIMKKYGHIMQEMIRDIKKYNITDAYAYNSDFDEKVFNFNCDWFKVVNPFDTVAIHDIWGYVSQFISCNDDYKAFCEEHQLFTENNNYSASAETVFQYLINNAEFTEDHMGASDAEIESVILMQCVQRGAELGKDYQVVKTLKRLNGKPFVIKINKQIIYQGEYLSKRFSKNEVFSFTVKGD